MTRNSTRRLAAGFALAAALAAWAGVAPAFAQSEAEAFLKRMDTDGSGTVSKEEYTAYRDKIFATRDRNKDGKVTHDEMMGMASGAFRERQSMRFMRNDANQDGAIDKAEFGSQTERLFAIRDRNKDGVLTADEMGRFHEGRGRGMRGGYGPGMGLRPAMRPGRASGPGSGMGPGGGMEQGR